MAFERGKLFALSVVVIVIFASFAVVMYKLSREDGPALLPTLAQPEFDENLADVLVGDGTIVYTYDSDPGKLNYTVGSYIVGTADTGYLRKITDISREGNVVTISTEDAALTDVIEDGELSVNQTLSMDGNLTRAGFSLSFDEVIYSSETDQSATEVRVYGDISIDTRLVFDISISKFKITELQFYVENTCSYNLGFEATHSITLEKEKEIFSKKLSKITFSIGPVPVVIIPEVSFSIGANLELNAQLATSLGGELTTRAGIMYDSNGWAPIATFERSSYFNPPSLDLTADATVYAISPNMVFYIYGVVGPSFQLRPYLHLNVAPFENPWWSLELGLEGSCGIEVKVFSKSLVSESFTLFDLTWPLAQADLKEIPGAPLNLAAAGGNGQVSLTWNPPSDDGGSDVTGYKIYRATSSWGAKTYLATVATPGFTNAGLSQNATYYYSVAAVNAIGHGPNSTDASARTFSVPGPPSSLTAVPGNKQVVLSWQAPIYTGGPALTGYKVYRGSSSGTETLLATVGTATVHTDTPLQNGETYYYKVSALNIVGEGARSAGYSVTTFDVPAIPMNLTLTPSDGQIHMEWQSPADDGGTPITNYTIYRGNSSGNEDYLITLGPVLNHTDISLTNGLTYYYKLSASNNVGEGLLSAEASAAPSATVISPSEPRNLAAFPGYRNVTLSWDPPSNNGGSAVTNYTIYRGTASGGETHLATIGNMLNYFDPMLSDGQQYYYKVSASNIAGEGAMSSETSVTTFAVPDAPDLTAIPTNSSVLLEWQPGGDGGSPVTGYEIYRGAVSGNLSHLASVGAVLFYNDGNLTNFQNYYYAVSAVNMVGEGAQSTETLAIPAPPVHNLDTNEYFDSIQGAIDDADTLNGHTITVMAGVFLEQVQIHKSLTVIGAGLDKCFIDADFVFTDFVVNISVDWVNLTGFTVRHCVFDENDPVGIKVDGEQCTVSDCCISDNEAKAIVSYRSNNTMMNNTITNNTGGIYIFGNDTSVLDNIMVNNSSGINIVNSCRSIIKRNSMVGGGISIDGGALENWNTHTIDTSNTVNGRPVQYWKDQNGGTVPAGAGQVLLANCMNVVVEGQGFDGVGLFIGFSGGSTIQGNNISHSQYGIFLQSSTGNTISGNNASDNENGIYLLSSGSNNVTSNTVNGNSGYGIYLSSSGGSSVQNNVIVNNKWGICLSASVTCHIANNTVAMNAIHGIFLSASSNSNIVLNNTVSDNNYGIFLALSSSNTIHHCNFVSNVNQAYDPHSNQWDDGSEGNYWSDYAGVDSEPNGIGDTPYAIPGGPNQDRYPLMVPWT